jgi:hypothetical protein
MHLIVRTRLLKLSLIMLKKYRIERLRIVTYLVLSNALTYLKLEKKHFRLVMALAP